jgi:acetyltransferase
VEAGLEIPPLSDKAKETLKENLHAAASINNPIDVLATGGAEHFRAAMDTLMHEPQIDSIFINFVTPFFVDTDSIAREIAEVNKTQRKPIICNLMTDKGQWTEIIDILKNAGVPYYSFPETAARALIAMTRYNDLKGREIGDVTAYHDVDKEKAMGILKNAKDQGCEFLSAEEVYDLLALYNIPAAKWRIAENPEEAFKAAQEIGFPVALKVDAESVVHKSDVGGIALDLTEDNFPSTVQEMEKKFDTEKPRFFVQEFLTGGKEMIIGAKVEPGLGHLILFGIGGIYVEILEDVAFGVTPITQFEAQEMLTTIKSHQLLTGFRGEKGVNQDKLIEILQRVSQLVTDLPIIQEMDLNPVMATEDSAMVVDARIKLLRE